MKRWPDRLRLFLWAAGVLFAWHGVVDRGVAAADDPWELSAEERAAGFQRIFNGIDLVGWEQVQGTAGTFEVKEGILVGQRRQGSAYWLSTREEYADFELRLDYRLRPGGNSGIFIRAPRQGRTSEKGMEIQLLDDGASPGKPGTGSTGAIYRVVAPSKFAARPAGEWNALAIFCQADRVRVTLNGQMINDALMSDHEPLKDRPRKGYIGLSAHSDVVEFRAVRLRKL